MDIPENVVYAGFWKRFVAIIIDYVLILLAYVIVISIFSGETGQVGRQFDIFYVIFTWLYFALMESSASRATLGKRALNLIVTDLHGNQISFLRATGRHFGKFVSSFILMIGFIMAAFTQRKQALHDMLASCLVLYNSNEAQELRNTKHGI